MKRNIKALLLIVLALTMVVALVACGHQHTFSTEWTTSATHHWQQANCGHDDLKQFEGEHQFGTGSPNAEGTQLFYTCRVCQYKKTEDIPVHQHTYEGDWLTQSYATMLAEGTEYRICTGEGCNERETRTVAKVEVASIAVTTQPAKTYYLAGETFDATGIVVTATGVDNSTANVTEFATFDKTTLAVADTAVVVSWQGKTAQVAITVHQHSYPETWQTRTLATVLAEGLEFRTCQGGNGCTEEETRTTAKAALVSIAITTQPSKTAYIEGTKFDATGIVVTATGDNGSTANVTALVSYDKTTLAVGDTTVTVTYEGKTAVVEITVEQGVAALSVTEVLTTAQSGNLVLVEGLFVGVSDVGHGYQREVLIKDVANDNLIAIQGMPDSYGTWPNIGYDKGDKVRLYATLVENKYVYSETDEANNETHNKKYLQFADANPADILDTVVSKDNIVSYSLDGMTVLEDWSDWQAFFKADTIKMYSYFTIKGEVCLNRYRGQDANGNVTMYRPHMVYTGVTGASSIKPDGTRAVGFRENALVANIGSAWDNYFSGCTWENNAGPSMNSKKKVEIVCVLTGMNRYNYQVTVLEAKWLKTEPVYLEISTNQDIVMEMAEAYLRQAGQLEYDQYSARRMTFATPEEATAQELGRFDCSSYVTSVYSNAFDIDAIPTEYFQNTRNYTAYAKEFEGDPNHADVVGYWEAMDYTTKDEQLAMLDTVRGLLQPGDILVYRHGTVSWTPGYSEADLRGHAILYMGNDQFSHSRGTDWNSSNTPDTGGIRNFNDPTKAQDRANDSEYTLGTVQYLKASEVLNIGTGTRMLFGERSDRVFNFSIIRPLARTVETPTLTEQMQKRLTVAVLSFEKLTSAGINSGVTRGQEITYTLEITNHYDNEHKNIAFNEVLPAGVSFVSSNFGAVANGQNVTGTFNVDGKEVITLKWTVRVDNNVAAGTRLCNVTTINGLLMKDITNSVVGYTQEQLNAVAAKAREYAASGAKFSDPMDLARAIYKEALGVELFGTETADSTLESLSKLYNPTDPTIKSYALNTESQYASMVAPNMYGGWHFYYSAGANEYIDNINLIRSPREHNLTLGDVIVAEWPTSKAGAATETTETRVYIYVGNGELVAIDSVTGTCTLEQNGSEEWVKSGSTWYQKHLLITLFAYQRFAVLRPGQIA